MLQLLLNIDLMHEASVSNYAHFLLLTFSIKFKFSQISAPLLSFAVGCKKRLQLKRNISAADKQTGRQTGRQAANGLVSCAFKISVLLFSGVFIGRLLFRECFCTEYKKFVRFRECLRTEYKNSYFRERLCPGFSGLCVQWMKFLKHRLFNMWYSLQSRFVFSVISIFEFTHGSLVFVLIVLCLIKCDLNMTASATTS